MARYTEMAVSEITTLDSGDSNEKLYPGSTLDTSTLPPELQSVHKEELKQRFDNPDSISILVIGETGSGKSTLINGILGLNVKGEQAKEGNSLETCTKSLKAYQTNKGKTAVTVWDSPGLQDCIKNEEYLKQMKQQCSKRDLTIYCIKMSETRLVHGSDEVKAMNQLTKTFEPEFWKTTVIVLTFANLTNTIDKDWDFLPEKEKPQVFRSKIQQWREKIQEILTSEIRVPEEIVKTIRIVPAGYYKKPHLPDCRYWLSNLWFNCISAIPSTEGQAALTKINTSRLKMEKDIMQKDFDKPIEEQPIVVDNAHVGGILGGTAGAVVGAAVGAGIGAIGLVSGLVAVFTIPGGFVAGGAIGYIITAIIATLINKKKANNKYISDI